MAELSAFAEIVRARSGGDARGIASVCSAHPVVLRAAFEQARDDGGTVLVESTSNQVNQEGGYTGVRPAEFTAFVGRLAEEAELPPERVILGGDHLGPNPWRERGATTAMARAGAMVRDYVRAGYAKIHLDASMACADDPPGPLAEAVVAARTADLAAAAEEAAAESPAGRPAPLYVVGTEVPPPGGQASAHGGPVPTRAPDVERTLALTREAFARRGLEHAASRVVALVVQPGVEFGDDVVFPYRREAAAELAAVADAHGLVYEAHSTDYQAEEALRALVQDRFAILKVGPELTFAFREAVFALEAIDGELLGRKSPDRLSGVGQALDDAMRSDPRHWAAWYGGGDEDTVRLRRRYSLSDRCRYYWTSPQVRAALGRLHANLEGRRLPLGLVSQYLPDAAGATAGDEPGLPGRLERWHVRRVLRRYARACHLDAAGGSAATELPLR
jgi:D-tagatose-1,6-bisphosphate aldolase subunit GatZ/KbaZ